MPPVISHLLTLSVPSLTAPSFTFEYILRLQLLQLYQPIIDILEQQHAHYQSDQVISL